MDAKAIGTRIKYIFMLTLFSGLCGLGQSIFTSITLDIFTGIPLFPLIVLAEGIIFWLAFKSDSLEKALNQISALRIISLILAAYAAYSLVMYFVRTFGVSFDLFEIWFQMVSNLSAVLASLAIFFAATTLKVGDTKKFNTASVAILIIEICLVISVSLAALIVADILMPVVLGIIMFLFLFAVVPKALGNKVIKGAIIGSIVAGDVGAVVGAIAASKSEKK